MRLAGWRRRTYVMLLHDGPGCPRQCKKPDCMDTIPGALRRAATQEEVWQTGGQSTDLGRATGSQSMHFVGENEWAMDSDTSSQGLLPLGRTYS
ncbi:hypothetical protein NDU88_001965 [Pleurodeles waltl]|uniref:Uncharacterized protein n=1 Tax=Pleurodeles waltl TaxID=8319 RepID=A0AAV7REB7_PLEWA|nr:hypothetical protein NDU88_001965 [Pleurodeles waltl]